MTQETYAAIDMSHITELSLQILRHCRNTTQESIAVSDAIRRDCGRQMHVVPIPLW